ncbi:MAG TPA: hypothetical protein VER58_16965 [Thermoanaerobaculia bacterium]|nr:hypothetical protein [Thermoanaerobaculia bacterium]
MNRTAATSFSFRPWVRRAGLSIVTVAVFATAAIVTMLTVSPAARFGWMSERVVWVYLGVLWLGGLRVFLATFVAIAEADDERLVVRPLHQLGRRAIPWSRIRGTEQSGDRLIIYYDTPRGMRFVALNLNLVKGRREFLALLDGRLLARGFAERTVERSRYLSRSGAER